MSSGILVVIEPGKEPREVCWSLSAGGRGPPDELIHILIKATNVQATMKFYLGVKRRVFMHRFAYGPPEETRLPFNDVAKSCVPSIMGCFHGTLLIDIPTGDNDVPTM
jgi:hypothetical protein